MYGKLLAAAFAVTLMGGVLVPGARADQNNKEVLFRINKPMDVPGRVLDPGRYELKLMGDGSPFAGIWNAQGNKFYGFFDTVPVTRDNSGKLRIDLAGKGKTAPKRLAEWFYPGDKTGNKFLYPAEPANVEVANRTMPRATVNR
jgi:hypothetical protein